VIEIANWIITVVRFFLSFPWGLLASAAKMMRAQETARLREERSDVAICPLQFWRTGKLSRPYFLGLYSRNSDDGGSQ